MLEHCYQVPKLGWIGDTITALACTGMRIGDLVNLKWSDIDFDNQRITLADESGRGLKQEARRTLKSGRSRSFPIHLDLLEVLARLSRRDEFVFRGPHGGRLKPNTVRRLFVRDVLMPLAATSPPNGGGQSLIDGRLDSFRHYFISMCAANKVSERVVMEWVGDADSAMTRHYFRLHDEDAKRQMDQLNFLGSIAGRSAGS
jgi:integrase